MPVCVLRAGQVGLRLQSRHRGYVDVRLGGKKPSADVPAVVAFETAGTYNGAPGTYKCNATDADCTVTLDAEGAR